MVLQRIMCCEVGGRAERLSTSYIRPHNLTDLYLRFASTFSLAGLAQIGTSDDTLGLLLYFAEALGCPGLD